MNNHWLLNTKMMNMNIIMTMDAIQTCYTDSTTYEQNSGVKETYTYGCGSSKLRMSVVTCLIFVMDQLLANEWGKIWNLLLCYALVSMIVDGCDCVWVLWNDGWYLWDKWAAPNQREKSIKWFLKHKIWQNMSIITHIWLS